MVGRAAEAGAYLLPAALRSGLAAPPSLDDTVRLGRLEAFRHRGLELEGFDPLLTLYSVPTSAGVVTAACFAPKDLADAFLPECERVASTMRLVGARALPVSPDAEYGEQVTAVVGRLNALRASRRGRFAGAQTPVGQADAAAGVANAYGAAAASLAASPPERRPERQANAAIVAALREAERAYVALARAARGNDRAGFNSARAAVRRAEGRVERSLRGLAAFGYAVR